MFFVRATDIEAKAMNKKGTTLIETVISIFLVSVVVVAFLEALNVGITGTLNLSRKTSALNLAKSQIEWVKAEPTYNESSGDLESVYDLITEGDDIGDVINYDISGQVSNVSANISLQQITVNVSYLNGKQVQLIGYKAARESSSTPIAKGQIVTDVIEEMPFEQPGGWALGCWFGANGCGTWTGYYHTFETSRSAYISATWKFYWHNELYPSCSILPWPPSGLYTWGAPYIGIYEGRPDWAEGDYDDGVVFRPGATGVLGSGCMPGCTCSGGTPPGDYDPIVQQPPSCSTDGSPEWYYEVFCEHEGYYEFTVTTPTAQPAGQYTVLFFNGEDRVSYETVSATVTFVY
jgi:Tfp pilus assembly protein PilV